MRGGVVTPFSSSQNQKRVNTHKTQTMTQNEVKSLVENSASSIFSKDDVLRLIASIEVEKAVKEYSITENFKEYLKNGIEQAVYDLNDTDSVDANSFEFSLCGNEIEVSDYSLDKDYIEGEIWDYVLAYLNEYQETDETEEAEEADETEEA